MTGIGSHSYNSFKMFSSHNSSNAECCTFMFRKHKACNCHTQHHTSEHNTEKGKKKLSKSLDSCNDKNKHPKVTRNEYECLKDEISNKKNFKTFNKHEDLNLLSTRNKKSGLKTGLRGEEFEECLNEIYYKSRSPKTRNINSIKLFEKARDSPIVNKCVYHNTSGLNDCPTCNKNNIYSIPNNQGKDNFLQESSGFDFRRLSLSSPKYPVDLLLLIKSPKHRIVKSRRHRKVHRHLDLLKKPQERCINFEIVKRKSDLITYVSPANYEGSSVQHEAFVTPGDISSTYNTLSFKSNEKSIEQSCSDTCGYKQIRPRKSNSSILPSLQSKSESNIKELNAFAVPDTHEGLDQSEIEKNKYASKSMSVAQNIHEQTPDAIQKKEFNSKSQSKDKLQQNNCQHLNFEMMQKELNIINNLSKVSVTHSADSSRDSETECVSLEVFIPKESNQYVVMNIHSLNEEQKYKLYDSKKSCCAAVHAEDSQIPPVLDQETKMEKSFPMSNMNTIPKNVSKKHSVIEKIPTDKCTEQFNSFTKGIHSSQVCEEQFLSNNEIYSKQRRGVLTNIQNKKFPQNFMSDSQIYNSAISHHIGNEKTNIDLNANKYAFENSNHTSHKVQVSNYNKNCPGNVALKPNKDMEKVITQQIDTVRCDIYFHNHRKDSLLSKKCNIASNIPSESILLCNLSFCDQSQQFNCKDSTQYKEDSPILQSPQPKDIHNEISKSNLDRRLFPNYISTCSHDYSEPYLRQGIEENQKGGKDSVLSNILLERRNFSNELKIYPKYSNTGYNTPESFCGSLSESNNSRNAKRNKLPHQITNINLSINKDIDRYQKCPPPCQDSVRLVENKNVSESEKQNDQTINRKCSSQHQCSNISHNSANLCDTSVFPKEFCHRDKNLEANNVSKSQNEINKIKASNDRHKSLYSSKAPSNRIHSYISERRLLQLEESLSKRQNFELYQVQNHNSTCNLETARTCKSSNNEKKDILKRPEYLSLENISVSQHDQFAQSRHLHRESNNSLSKDNTEVSVSQTVDAGGANLDVSPRSSTSGSSKSGYVPPYHKALAMFRRRISDPQYQFYGWRRTRKSRGSKHSLQITAEGSRKIENEKKVLAANFAAAYANRREFVGKEQKSRRPSTSPAINMNGVHGINGHGDLNGGGGELISQNLPKGCWTIGLINSKFRYLTAETFGFKINANGASLKKKQIWTLEPSSITGNESTIYLRSHLDKYLAVDSFGNVTCEGEERDPGSKFQISVADDGTGRWALRNVTRGYYLGASADKLACTAKVPGDSELWHVHLAARPQVNLRSIGRKRFAHLSENLDEIHVDANIPWGEDTLFTLEFRVDESGKYALHTCNNKYLSREGKLVDTCNPNCLFSAEYHSGQLALRDRQGAYLSPIGSKAVLKTRSQTVTKDELFSLEDSLPQASFVAALNGRYVSVKQGVDVTANQDEISDHETFQLEFDGSTKRWYIRTMQDRYWTLETGGGIQACGDKKSSNALFDLVWQGDGSVGFRANNGKFVSTKRSGHLYANCDTVEDNAKYFFYLINRPILVLKCEQGFVGYKSASSPKLECNKATYETIQVERSEKGVVFFKGQNGKYWHVDGESVTADSDVPEGFFLELRDPTRICIKSVSGEYLVASKNGAFRLGDSDFENATKWEY